MNLIKIGKNVLYYLSLWFVFVAFNNWLSPINKDFLNTDDESELFMRRYLENKSWFDSFANAWVEKSSAQKIAWIIGVSLLSGFVGLIISAPILLVITTFFFSLVAHALLKAHETKRYLGAKLFTVELIAATKDIKDSENFFKDTANGLKEELDDMKKKSIARNHQIINLEQVSKEISTTAAACNDVADELISQSKTLLTKQNDVNQQLSDLTTTLDNYDEQLIGSQQTMVSFHETIGFFSQGVHSFEKTEKKFTEQTQEFSTFMEQQMLVQTTQQIEQEKFDSDFALSMTEEADQMDRIIANL